MVALQLSQLSPHTLLAAVNCRSSSSSSGGSHCVQVWDVRRPGGPAMVLPIAATSACTTSNSSSSTQQGGSSSNSSSNNRRRPHHSMDGIGAAGFGAGSSPDNSNSGQANCVRSGIPTQSAAGRAVSARTMSSRLTCLAADESEGLLAAGGADGTIHLWDPRKVGRHPLKLTFACTCCLCI